MILQINNRFLLTKIPEEVVFTSSHKTIAISLLSTMYALCGAGLAANQVGLKVRAFAAAIGDPGIVCFNPKITERVRGFKVVEEGCLSYPDTKLSKLRFPEIAVSWQDFTGKEFSTKLIGFDAVVFQHELDHLNGINWSKEK
jgi:peptide deformylase